MSHSKKVLKLSFHCSKVVKGRKTPAHSSCASLTCECPCHSKERA